MSQPRLIFSDGKKFDVQLTGGHKSEVQYGGIMMDSKTEVKRESYLWELTRNICIEYRHNGKPSGIWVTEAEWWAHELVHTLSDETEVSWGYLVLPVWRLKELCRDAFRKGAKRCGVGDDGLSDVILVRLADLWSAAKNGEQRHV